MVQRQQPLVILPQVEASVTQTKDEGTFVNYLRNDLVELPTSTA